MIGAVRSILRKRRGARQIARDDSRDQLLNTEIGRKEYLDSLALECHGSSLVALLEDALKHPGDVVECGVFRGASLRRILKTVGDMAHNRTTYGLDSFEGFPPDGITKFDMTWLRPKSRLESKFTNASDVPDRLARFAQAFDVKLELLTGYFEATLPLITNREFCFLHIDCDTYAGHLEILEALYSSLVPGGIIVYDDYGSEAWPGATQAVDEFFADKGVKIEQSFVREHPAWYSVKPD